MRFYLETSKHFQIVDKRDLIYLSHSTWDDWFRYNTLYNLYYYNKNGQRMHLGSVKIGQTKMRPDQRSPDLPEKFEELDNNLFSLGQDVSYYEELNKYGEDFRQEVLNALNDIAYNEESYQLAIKESVTKISLLRDVSQTSIEGQYRKLAQGNAELTPYNFRFVAPKHLKSQLDTMNLTFNVIPNSNPPTNIHVIIGRNGVGKTHLFNNMISSILNNNNKFGRFLFDDGDSKNSFANLISVSFSAFDETIPSIEQRDKTKQLNYSYIGLKKISKETGKILSKSPIILKNNFVKSVEKCILGAKNHRWIEALEMLETDPIFKEAEVSKLGKLNIDEDFSDIAADIFNKLSSGHKIVLLTITQLVEATEEKSLVLLDEPEGYLHPPLLSAFIRALSNLLIRRNAVAIIGTHSPVVLQEVPKSCVWKLRRRGADAIAERLEIESFGENVGLLTQEVFGLEVTDAGFHKIIKNLAEKYNTYEDAIAELNNQLGQEGKAILRNLLY